MKQGHGAISQTKRFKSRRLEHAERPSLLIVERAVDLDQPSLPNRRNGGTRKKPPAKFCKFWKKPTTKPESEEKPKENPRPQPVAPAKKLLAVTPLLRPTLATHLLAATPSLHFPQSIQVQASVSPML